MYEKQTWVDNTSIVDAEKLNHIEDGIYENSEAIDGVIDGNVYSTDEVDTGKKWINNKPIYRKVLTGTTSNGYATNIFAKSNFDTMISCCGWVGNNTVGYMQLGSYLNDNYSGGFYIDTTLNYLQIYITPDTLHGKSYYAIVEYTKPTD